MPPSRLAVSIGKGNEMAHDKREEYMDHINSSSSSLLNIVDSMIDVSLLEVGEICVRKEEIMKNEKYYSQKHWCSC